MTQDTHTWAVEFVEGGPDGGDDFYRCMTCGCSGGGTTGFSFKGRIFRRTPDEPTVRMEVYDRKPSPFLPGPAIDLSMDCATAHEQILFFVRGYIRSWDHSGKAATDQQRELRQILRLANRYTPSSRPRVEFYQLMWDADSNRSPGLTADHVKRGLVGRGFKLECPKCSKCDKPTDRPGDDANELCYSCDWREYVS